MPQLEPRSFSFNSPYGACEECAGLGSTWSFDPSKVIADPSKPLLDGALGVGASATSMLEQISQAGARLGLDLTVPFEQLPKKTQNMLLNGGTGFPGIMRLLDDRFRSSSEAVPRMADGVHVADRVRRVPRQAVESHESRGSGEGCGVSGLTDMPIARALKAVSTWELTEREDADRRACARRGPASHGVS